MLDSDDLDEERKAQTSISYRDLKTTVYLPVPKNPKNRNSPNVSA
jgi:hypothetical protein